MLLEKTARILLDYGVQLLVCFGERVERVGHERWVECGLGEGEDVEENLGREGVEMCRHCCGVEI
jgi:hypothetical protein